MEKGGQLKVYSSAQMALYFTQDYYKMIDVNLKNFKVMLSKECSYNTVWEIIHKTVPL